MIRRAARLGKDGLAELLYHSGLWRTVKRLGRDRHPVVLTYHRVLPAGDIPRSWSHPTIIVSSETFEVHMRLLRRWFNPLTLAEFTDRLLSGRGFAPGSCLVTFDDGWADTYTEAWPSLRRHAIPAVVFLPVQYIGTGTMFWQEEMGALLLGVWQRVREAPASAGRAGEIMKAVGLSRMLEASEATARATAHDLVRSCKRHGTDVVPILAALRELNGGPPSLPVDGFMNWTQVREMAAAGVAFGGHGVTHRLLPSVPEAELRHEVGSPRRVISDHLGHETTSFAYPNGDWNQPVADAVRHEGYAVAFSTDEGQVDPAHRYCVRRINMHESATRSPALFLARVLGLT
jgi:peptidoglycan/xylan/chitin deacetylase (PgdA/CDA1 family)